MSEISQTERVSDEELDQMIWKLERDGMTPKQLSLMRELREVRREKGEPVAYMTYKGYLLHAADPKLAEYSEPMPLYIAPPATVVHDECALFEAVIDKCRKSEAIDEHAWNNGVLVVMAKFEECRTAMQSDGTLTNEDTMQLSGNSEQLEPVSNRDELNSQVTPDGWKLVPIVPTEDMVINGLESEPDPHFSDEKEWGEYNALSGCRQAARRAELCWAAMIAAAPKEVG